MEIEFLTLEDVLALHDELIQRYGGTPGLRDAGLLEAALAMPQAGFGSQYFHEFPPEMAAAYLFHLVRNHAFIDGNKRVALACAILFLKINRVSYSITEEEAVELTLEAASGNVDKGAVTAFFRKHLKI
ncbi:MAG: Death-on-curing family protein [Acidobacteria bacterium]|nr:Death-on-curing family protein [Acidobacteriota bacterium]